MTTTITNAEIGVKTGTAASSATSSANNTVSAKPYDPDAIVYIVYTGKTPAILYSSTDFSKVEVMPNSKSPVLAKFVYNSSNPFIKALRYKSIKYKQAFSIPNGQTFTQFVDANFSGVNK